MRNEDMAVIVRLRLLRSLSRETHDKLCNGAFLQMFPPSTELVQQGQRADFLHVVVEGSIEVFSSYRDRETTVTVVGPGDCFILAAVILDRPYLKSARTLTRSRVLLLPSENVRRAFMEDPDLARRLTNELALDYRRVVKELNNQKLRSNLERLANWILTEDAATGRTGSFSLPFEKKVLAARLGMAPEVLSRTFANLVAYGVRVDSKMIEVGDREALLSLAQPSPLIDEPETLD
jgi:CRP/FNR family transcriptional regulator, transcriptional activator FtrB